MHFEIENKFIIFCPEKYIMVFSLIFWTQNYNLFEYNNLMHKAFSAAQ